MSRIVVGDPAPRLTFTTHQGEQVNLADYHGKRCVVVFFYPKDGTPACTKEACAFRDTYVDFVEAGAAVIGVSGDSEGRHRDFAADHRLPFALVSDKDGSLRRAFGVPKSMGIFPGRVTYVIDLQGTVQHVFSSQFATDRHVEEALGVIKRLTA